MLTLDTDASVDGRNEMGQGKTAEDSNHMKLDPTTEVSSARNDPH